MGYDPNLQRPVVQIDGQYKQIIHEGNIGSQSVAYASSAGSAPASDVYAWAKASTKPVYSWNELTDKPTIPTNTNQLTNGAGFITAASIPSSLPASDVYAWAKASSKPSYNFGEIGAGTAIIGDGANRLMFRTHDSYLSGIYYSTPGNESLVFANGNAVTS